jgi:hypothetical protein
VVVVVVGAALGYFDSPWFGGGEAAAAGRHTEAVVKKDLMIASVTAQMCEQTLQRLPLDELQAQLQLQQQLLLQQQQAHAEGASLEAGAEPPLDATAATSQEQQEQQQQQQDDSRAFGEAVREEILALEGCATLLRQAADALQSRM